MGSTAVSALLSLLSALLVLFVARRIFIAGRRAARVDLTGKTVVVTGASPGSIGFATVRALAEWGARVVMTTRAGDAASLAALTRTLSSEAARARVTVLPLDLSLAESVSAFARALEAETAGELDVLVNNAGVHLDLANDWKAPKLSADGYETHWRTNYLGTAHLTHLLLPMLRRAARARGEARVVNVVSKLHTLASNDQIFEQTRAYNSWHAYGRSKLALVHATREFERRHGASEGVHAYALHPGSVYSKVADKGLEGKRLIGAVRRVLAPVEAFFLKTTDEGAQTTLHCATAKGLTPGGYFEDCAAVPASKEADDASVAARLVAQTDAWCAEQGT